MIKYIILTAVTIFFSLNMGASGVAPSFAATYGGKLIKRKTALIIFGIFVVIGAVTFGRGVAITLGKGLMPQEAMTFDTVLQNISAAVLRRTSRRKGHVPKRKSGPGKRRGRKPICARSPKT